jgi:tetratricopeptide (TPR) repeat protein
VSVLLFGTSLAVFAPACGFDFVNYDDAFYVTENAHVRAGLTLDGLRWACTSLTAFWHPLTWLSLQLDAGLFGLDPGGFHRTNLLLHAVNGVLLFWVLRRLTGRLGRSAAVALLFALHPLHVETVAWVSERKGLLSTLFGLLTIAVYAWYVRRPRWDRYLLVFAMLTLALMAKPILVTLPLALLLLDYWPLQRLRGQRVARHGCSIRRLLAEKLPLVLPALAVCWLTMVAEQKVGAVRLAEQASLPVCLGNAAVACVQYLAKTLWPSGLTIFYPRPRTPWGWGPVLAAGALLLLILGLALSQARRRPYLAVGWLWFLGTLVPVIGLVQVGSHLLADRYTYWPHVGLLVLLVWGVYDFLEGRQAAHLQFPLTGALAVACLIASRQQLDTWRDSRALWRHALDVTENNCIAHNNLGTALLDQGRADEAVPEFEEALRILPSYWEPHSNLGMVARLRGDRAGAKEFFAAAVECGADRDYVFANLGDLYWLDGQAAEAQACFETALGLNPDCAEAHAKLGLVLLAQGKAGEAEIRFSRALQEEGERAELHGNLGAALYNQGRVDEAIDQLIQAVHLDPRYVAGHVKLGLALQRRGRFAEALAQDEEALRLDPGLAEAHNQRGMALESLGRATEAVDCYRQAVHIEPRLIRYRCNLASALHDLGQSEAAREAYREADRLRPGWPGEANRVARGLATAADARLRFGALALRLARQACQATGDKRPEFFETLAAARVQAEEEASPKR